VQTEEVQGEGSYVVIRKPKVREIRELRQQRDSADVDTFEVSIELISDHLVDWNWVDDDDNPLPLPSQDPSVIDELNDEETEFLASILIGTREDRKNLQRGS
jgi:hypothetical protein